MPTIGTDHPVETPPPAMTDPVIAKPEGGPRIPRRDPGKADDVGSVNPSGAAATAPPREHPLAKQERREMRMWILMLAFVTIIMIVIGSCRMVGNNQTARASVVTTPPPPAVVATEPPTSAVMPVVALEPELGESAQVPLVAPRPVVDALAAGPNEFGVEYLSQAEDGSWSNFVRQFTLGKEDCAKLYGADFVCRPVVLSMTGVTAAYVVSGEPPKFGENDYVVFAEADEEGTHQAVLRSCALAAITGLPLAEGAKCPQVTTITWRHYGQREAMNLASREKAGAIQASATPAPAQAKTASSPPTPSFGAVVNAHERRLQALEAKVSQGS